MFKRMGVFVCAVLAIAVAVEGATVSEYSRKTPAEYEHSNKRHGDLPFSFFTPRIEWARPFNLGKLKLLIVAPVQATRESVELGSRLDADIKVINLKLHDQWFGVWDPSGGQFYNSVPEEEVLHDAATRLLSPAYKYDAMVIGHVKWTAIPDDIRKLILGRIKSGAALVFVSPWDVDEGLQKEFGLGPTDNLLVQRIRESVPLSILPLDMDMEPLYPKPIEPRRIGPMEIRTGKLGEGNVVFLDYKDVLHKDGHPTISPGWSWNFYCGEIALTPFVEDDDLFYDYYFSILAKVLLHAAGKDTGIKIRPEAVEISVEQKQLPGSPVGFVLASGNGMRDGDVTIYYELRDRQNQVVKKGELPVSREGEKSRVAPEIPSLAQGLYILDAWVMRGGTVADWASAALHVTGMEHIEAIVPDKEFFSRNEPITGTVKFKTSPKGVSVSMELWDTYNRLEQTTQPAAESGKFQFQWIENPLSRTYRIVGKVLEKGLVTEQKDTWVGLPSSDVDDFQFAVWAGAHNTRGNRTLMQLLSGQAVTAYYDTGWFLSRRFKFQAADAIARNNLLALPYTSGCWDFSGEGGPWSTEAYYREINLPSADAYRRYGAMAYTICEENYFSADEKSWSRPAALNDYRLYLKERYGDIGRLNEIWGAPFKSFDEIGLISFQDAQIGRQFSRWMEQQRHRVDRFTKALEMSSRAIRESDPEARMTLDSCVPEMYDWQRTATFIQGWGRWCPLERWLDKNGVNWSEKKGNLACIRDIGWYPNTISEWFSRTTPWQDIFLGYSYLVWWAGDLHAFTPDRCEPVLTLKQTAEECREIENGTGKLLLGSKKRLDPILILWSPSSYYASVISPMDAVWNTARESFETMVRHMGFDYQYIGEDFLENNLVYGANRKVLILPASQAISRKGVEKIKAFAQSGGLVIADYLPAVMDEYLRSYGKPASAEGKKVEFQTCPKCNGAKQILIEAFLQACPACGGTGSIVKGGERPTKSILEDVFDFSKKGTKSCGKGYGLFLAGSPDKREEWSGLRKGLIEKQGIRGDVEILDVLGNMRSDLNWHVFDNGRAKFVGIVAPQSIATPPGKEFSVRLKEKQHGYNVRMHKYLGLADMFQSGIAPTEPKLFAFLPEQIEGVRLSVPKTAYRPGETVNLGVAILPASLSDSCLVVRVEVRKGDCILPEHTGNVSLRGKVQHPIPLALNQEKGEYRVRVTEVISGHVQEVAFRVK